METQEYVIKNRKYNGQLLIAYELYCLRKVLEDIAYGGGIQVDCKSGGDNELRVREL